MASKFSLPKVGDKVDIKVLDPSYKEKYVSQILNVLDEYTYEISGPIHKRNIVPLSLGLQIKVMYCKEQKGRFMFKAKIIEREKKPIYKIKIERLNKIKRLQERNFYRLPIMIKVIKQFQNMKNKEIEKEECITEDISGGGLRILCNKKHNLDDIVLCKFTMNGIELSLKCQVVRTEDCDNKNYKYSLGMKFIDITDYQREKIIKFIFDEQRKLRQKGLI
ncbi:flagellar brake protein [Thermohalobacter berrensis]|uniref:Pilus assembly protein PilZ n=1 Tax=Thermohalobacter berrensis TaxID=99594 RepID=A0A419TAG0_9FIRM|nr:flagellar brake protein [Thermohalobacter berrensis]RKD34455.1 hypothetical protein BET03_01070 [Thermohalobacter berrensis]